MKIRTVCVGSAAAAIVCLVCGCSSSPKAPSQSQFPMYGNYVKVNDGKLEPGVDIPPAYWTDQLKSLRPLRVYTHKANIVVVQKMVGDIEEGKYITVATSSYLPQSGDDGFQFTARPTAEGLDFKRIKKELTGKPTKP